ncbi:MAG: FeoA family protein [Luteolibacter sp.]|jgi:ferrous iron transport protein A
MISPHFNDAKTDSFMGLGEAAVGCDFRIRFLAGPASEQLRRLGFCESLAVRKISNGRNVICSISGTRLALSRELANHVKVSPLFAA